MPRSTTDITELYAPQFEQFGLELKSKGPTFTGEVANDRANGRAWIMPLSPTCLVMEHFITPTHDMNLLEYTPEPYACVSEISEPTLACMPDAGIAPANLKPMHGTRPNSAMCSFIQDVCGEELSPLFAGQTYHSRSVLFLPGFFQRAREPLSCRVHGAVRRIRRAVARRGSLRNRTCAVPNQRGTRPHGGRTRVYAGYRGNDGR